MSCHQSSGSNHSLTWFVRQNLGIVTQLTQLTQLLIITYHHLSSSLYWYDHGRLGMMIVMIERIWQDIDTKDDMTIYDKGILIIIESNHRSLVAAAWANSMLLTRGRAPVRPAAAWSMTCAGHVPRRRAEKNPTFYANCWSWTMDYNYIRIWLIRNQLN